jgi:hypothetical protein
MAINTYPVDGNTKTAYPTELTEEVLARLGAPVPAADIQTMPVGGQNIRFTSDKFVFHRLNDVVGIAGWEDYYDFVAYPKPLTFKTKKDKDGNVAVVSTITGTMTCRLVVLGVTKSSTADVELEAGAYGTPATNVQARILKRAAMKFGIAAELWEKDVPAATAVTHNSSQAPSTPAGGSGLASDKQVGYLVDAFDVPKVVASKLTGGRDGEASQLITAIKGGATIGQALKTIGRTDLVSLLHTDDEDED